MKKFFSAIAKLLVVFLLFYYVVNEGILQNIIQPAIDWFVEMTQDETEPASPSVSSDAPAEGTGGSFIIVNPYEAPDEVDDALLRDEILRLTNELRTEHGAQPLAQNAILEQAANIRAVETGESFSHTRPDGTEFHTVFDDTDEQYQYSLAGENLAMGTHHLSDSDMAAFLFEGWVESEGHFQNMIEPNFEEMGVGVYYDGEILYLVQVFGTHF